MTNPLVRIHNMETNQIIDREMNAEELAHYEANKAQAEATLIAEAEAKAAKSALLAKLGITESEAALLLS